MEQEKAFIPDREYIMRLRLNSDLQKDGRGKSKEFKDNDHALRLMELRMPSTDIIANTKLAFPNSV